MSDLLKALRDFDALRDRDTGGDEVRLGKLESITPEYAADDALQGVTARVRQALIERGIDRLFQHQADAIQTALAGRNVVLQAPTASGKSLAFQVPMLNTLAMDRKSHALMIFPSKALSIDQRAQLELMAKNMGAPRIDSWWFDGDVESEQRQLLKGKPPRVLITTPDMLHASFLGYADQWQGFLRNLKFIVVDEMHEYRGYFGSNVALILRRLSHHLTSIGANPQFFLCSATCANAKEHAENLTGLPFVEVNASRSMRPHRDFYFVKPDIPEHQYWDILQLRAVNAGLASLSQGRAVLVFCPTRNFAESCHRLAIREVEKRRAAGTDALDADSIKVFRAGLSTDMRHDIQDGLKSGVVKLVFATNALELGIDIGGLDGVVLAGFPDSMMSAWQRIGRAGRSWEANAFVLYYARNNPLDQFYSANLDTFLNKPLDDLVVYPGNEELVEQHLPCVMFETVGTGNREVLGDDLREAIEVAERSGAKPVRSGRWRPHRAVNVRGGGTGVFRVMSGEQEIGTLSGYQQFRDAYPRAIYMHGGTSYRVESVEATGDGGNVHVVPAESFLKTSALTYSTATEVDLFAGVRWESDSSVVSVMSGKVSITEVVSAIEETNDLTGEIVDRWVPESNQAQFSNAHAFWVELDFAAPGPAEGHEARSVVGVAELQHLLRVGVLFTVPIDAHDVYPYAVVRERKVYIVESYPGGIGIARKGLERWRDILQCGIDVAKRCDCVDGCPNCIVPPRSREDLDKRHGIGLAENLLRTTDVPHTHIYAGGLWKPVV